MVKKAAVARKRPQKSYSSRNFKNVFGIEFNPALAIPECYSFVVDEKALLKSKLYKKDLADNKKLAKQYGPALSRNEVAPATVRFVNDKVGHGLFAKRKIKKGTLIGEYTGLLIRRADAEDDNYYLFTFPGEYLNEKGKKMKFYIDARRQGNFIRFVNHSNDHVNVEVLEVPYNGRWYIAYVACEDIPAGAQLLVDYGKFYWADQKKKPAKLKP